MLPDPRFLKMNTLAFDLVPSPGSNDHQARITIDGKDWLGDDYLGIDPPDLFVQPALKAGGKLLAGRCSCGCEGCDDVWVEVARDKEQVVWIGDGGIRFHFDATEYDRTIEATGKDFSWEDTKRTAERLVSAFLKDKPMVEGHLFNWASARCQSGRITLSYSNNGIQKLLEFDWNGASANDALANAIRFWEERSDG